MVPPRSQNTVGVCNQITLLILYFIISRWVTLLKVTDTPIQVSDIFDYCFKFINFSFQIFLLLVPEISISFSLLHCLDYLHCFGLDPLATAL